MNIKTIFIFCFFTQLKVLSQSFPNAEIDSNNYYSFYKNDASITKWLEEDDVLNIMEDILKEHNIDYSKYSILKLDNNNHIRLTAFLFDYKIGILYARGHSMFPKKTERGLSADELATEYKYFERIESLYTSASFCKFKIIPDNIIFLPQNSYWYQEWKNSKSIKGVSKDVISKIFREDFRRLLLAKIKK